MEQEAVCFIGKMAELYLMERDMEGLIAKMHPDISWLGTGENEISKGIVEARKALEQEVSEYNGAFKIIDKILYATKLSDTAYVVYGWVHAIPEYKQVEDQNLHLTAICVQTNQGMKLVHCNLSRPDCMQSESSYYVPPHERADNKTLRDALESQERWLEKLTRNIPGGVHRCLNDADLTIISISDSFLELFGYTQSEIEKKFDNKFINMVYEEDRQELMRKLTEQLTRGTNVEMEYRAVTKQNETLCILEKSKLLEDENGQESFYCVLVDITQRKRVQEELRLSLERHKIIIDQATDIIFEWDIKADILSFSPNWRKKFGYDPIEKQISEKIPFSDNIHPEDMPAFVKIMKDTAMGVPYSETEFRIRDITGRYWWCRIRATAQFDRNGHAITAVGVITDISAEKEERLALMEQAQKDALTGLYNKSAIKIKVEYRMQENYDNAMQAMLIIDVDYFKMVNDTYGHLCGDTLLSNVAELLKKHFRASDVVGRIGGDEFLVYMPMVTVDIVQSKVQFMLEDLSSIRPSKDAPAITCSVGVAILPYKKTDYFGLYQAADSALYYRKSIGRNGVSIYDSDICDNVLTGGLARSAVGEFIDSDKCSTVEETLSQYTFKMLYQSMDVETAVNRLLEIVGRAYSVSRVYIFENSEDGLCCNNTFEWCAPDISPEIENLQGIRYKEDLGGYIENFNEEGVFYCHDISTLSPKLYNILEPQGICSILQCAVQDRGKFKGYVGFDECRGNCSWSKEQIRSLTLISNVLSVFLIKLRMEEKIEQMKEIIR